MASTILASSRRSVKKNSAQKGKREAGLGKAGNGIIDDTENSKMPYLFTH